MAINRLFFFDQLHDKLYPNGLHQSQVDGHTAILDAWEETMATSDDRWLAYMLGTAYHETAKTMQPVCETLASSDDQAIARLERAWDRGQLAWVREPYWRKDADGHSWFGRGLVQLTHKNNYATMKRVTGIDLVGHPEKALEMETAIQIMFKGMHAGSFTSHKLADYFHGTTADWTNARRIINGTESATLVAGHAKAYYAAISYTTGA